jgi:hypothetical protein
MIPPAEYEKKVYIKGLFGLFIDFNIMEKCVYFLMEM